MKSNKAVILLSGGLDSATCLAIANNSALNCYALSFDYGQKHNIELSAAKKIARYFQVQHHEIVTLSIASWAGSALTDATINVPDHTNDHSHSIPITYVPARNTIFLSIALSFAEMLHANSIFIGVSAIDYSGYPDCRPEYIHAFQQLANLATKAAVENRHPIIIETPLITLTKKETIAIGIKLGVDYGMTVSCYRATLDGLACGHCDSCILRKTGFDSLGIQDPTQYA